MSVSEAAERLGVKPRVLSDAFYDGRLDESRCPIVGKTRVIPAAYLESIAIELRRAGHRVAFGNPAR